MSSSHFCSQPCRETHWKSILTVPAASYVGLPAPAKLPSVWQKTCPFWKRKHCPALLLLQTMWKARMWRRGVLIDVSTYSFAAPILCDVITSGIAQNCHLCCQRLKPKLVEIKAVSLFLCWLLIGFCSTFIIIWQRGIVYVIKMKKLKFGASTRLIKAELCVAWEILCAIGADMHWLVLLSCCGWNNGISILFECKRKKTLHKIWKWEHRKWGVIQSLCLR